MAPINNSRNAGRLRIYTQMVKDPYLLMLGMRRKMDNFAANLKEVKPSFAQAYLSGWFSNYVCLCGEWFGPDGLEKAREHFYGGHYD